MLDVGWALSGSTTLVVLLFLISTGMPIALAMLGTSIISTMLFLGPNNLEIIALLAFNRASDQLFSVIPLFVMMGVVASTTGITERTFAAGSAWLNRLPGSLAASSVFASTAFASISGSSPATAATVGYFAIPEMAKYGYKKPFALGAIAAGGTLGILIPPSVAMIIFGLVTGTSIGDLFIGGILPGIMLSVALSIYVMLRAWRNPSIAPRSTKSATWPERFKTLYRLWPFAALFLAVVGSIYLGIATPSESAAIGAAGALLLAIGVRRLTLKNLHESLRSAVETTSMVLFLIIGGYSLSFLFGRLGVATGLQRLILDMGVSPWGVLIAVIVLLILLGMILDPSSLIVITMPLFFEVLTGLGFNAVWIGVLVVITAEIGMITPPIGMNVLILRNLAPDVPTSQIFAGAIPYVAVLGVGLMSIMAFPALALWLPGLM